MTDELAQFLHTFKITPEDFDSTQITWEELLAIKDDYRSVRKELNLLARYIEDKLQGIKAVHSIRCRIKDPDHMLAKIVRKRIEHPTRKISLANYRSHITDLVGIRAIHLFKEDWVPIHDFIESTWDLFERPIAYIRAGDTGPHVDEYERREFDIKPHPFGYRSIHYLITSKPSKEIYLAEIQVRTIFEEGWSEIDHTIKYPKNVSDPLLDTFLDNFNILAGNSDQMGSFVRKLKEDLVRGTAKLEMYEKLTAQHTGIINTLKRRVAGTLGELNAKLRTVEKQVDALAAHGGDTTVFERVLDQTRDAVTSFGRMLERDPRAATELFERSIDQLERLEVLLGICLELVLRSDEEEGDDRLARLCVRRATRFTGNVRLIEDVVTSRDSEVRYWKPFEHNHDLIAELIETARERTGIARKMLGPDFSALKKLGHEVEAHRTRLEALREEALHVEDEAVCFVMLRLITQFGGTYDRIETFIKDQRKGSSVFGWLFESIA